VAAGAEVVEATTQAEVNGVAGAAAGTSSTKFNVSENPLFTSAAAAAAAGARPPTPSQPPSPPPGAAGPGPGPGPEPAATAAAAADAGNFTGTAAKAPAAEEPKAASPLAVGTTPSATTPSATTPGTTAPSSYRWVPNEPQLARLDEIFASGISFSRGVEVWR
jgi:hypothetical protein